MILIRSDNDDCEENIDCENVDCDCEEELDIEEIEEDCSSVCEHDNIIEKEFNKNSCRPFEGSIIISVPHTVRFVCRDCGMPIDIFITGGVFNY